MARSTRTQFTYKRIAADLREVRRDGALGALGTIAGDPWGAGPLLATKTNGGLPVRVLGEFPTARQACEALEASWAWTAFDAAEDERIRQANEQRRWDNATETVAERHNRRYRDQGWW